MTNEHERLVNLRMMQLETQRAEARAECDAEWAQVAYLLSFIRDMNAQLEAMRPEIDRIPVTARELVAARAEAERLRAALEKYGNHTPNCGSYDLVQDADGWGWAPCDCGLEAALKEQTNDPLL